jgi:hypothetical protein
MVRDAAMSPAASKTLPEGQSMTEQEYLDPQRFPLTSQAGLTFKQQKMIDAVNLDDIEALLERGETLTKAQQQALAELWEKKALREEGRP